MSSTDEIEDNLSLFVVDIDDMGALLSVETRGEDRRRVENLEKYALFIRTEDGMRRVKRLFLEFDDEFNDFLDKEFADEKE